MLDYLVMFTSCMLKKILKAQLEEQKIFASPLMFFQISWPLERGFPEDSMMSCAKISMKMIKAFCVKVDPVLF